MILRTAIAHLSCAVRHVASKRMGQRGRFGPNFVTIALRYRYSSFSCVSVISSTGTITDDKAATGSIPLPVGENTNPPAGKVKRKLRSRRRSNTGTPADNTNGSDTANTTGNQAFYDARWMEHFQSMRSFMEQSKRNDATNAALPEDVPLRRWISRQKMEYRKKCNGQPTTMTDQRLQLLESTGFSLQALRKRSWDNVYDQLCEYVTRNNDFPNESSDGDAEEQRLFHWCQRQRVNYTYYRLKGRSRRSTLMTEERIAMLEQIHFSWSLRDVFWDEKYRELKDYYQHHNDCLVPAAYVSNMSLAKWVERQRKQYLLLKQGKPSGLTEPRLALLNKLDFVWDASEHKWRQKYKELTEYQRNNGHGVLPRKNDPDMAPLCRWLLYQKNTYRKWIKGDKSSLTTQRIALLEKAGVQWSDTSVKPVMFGLSLYISPP